MRPAALLAFLTKAIGHSYPVLIVSAPGQGKSDIIQQAIAAAGADLIMSHPAIEDPVNTAGFPFPSEDRKSARMLPFGNLERGLRATVPTVWVLEDFGQGSDMVQKGYMQLLLTGCVGEHVLPDCVTFIAATNAREHGAGVQGLLEPIKSRFLSIVTLETHIDDWCECFAYPAGIHPEVIAFLRVFPNLLSDFERSADLVNCPLPRTWENVSKVLYMELPRAIEDEVLAGAVGESAANQLQSFRDMNADRPNVDEILRNPDGVEIPSDVGALYATVIGLSMRATVSNFGKVARYTTRLIDADRCEFAALLVQNAERLNKEITQTPDFAVLTSGPIGELIGAASSNGA